MMTKMIVSSGSLKVEVIQCDSTDHTNSVALVRKWKAKNQEMTEFTDRWKVFREEFPFDKVLLVIDNDKDEGLTEKAILGLSKIPDWLCPVWVSGCGDGRNWCQLLNAGLLALTRMNPSSDCQILCSSFDAVARPGFGEAYAACDQRMPVPMIGIRQTLPESHTKEMAEFVNDNNFLCKCNDIMRKLEIFFSGNGEFPENFVPVLKQMCRNTMQIWRLDALRQIGGFDIRCNEWGGQEDLMAFLMIMLQMGFKKFPVSFFHYDDSTVSSKKNTYLSETQDEKGLREDQAVVAILEELRKMFRATRRTSMIRVPSPMFGL